MLIGGFMRLVISLLCAILLSVPSLAQTHKHMNQDKDMKISGNGKIPAGWEFRFDHKNADLSKIQFTITGNEFHFVIGAEEAAIYYNKKDIMNGNFKCSADFFQTKQTKHAEAFGLFWGGKDLQGNDQHYYYFLVRQDGKYLIKSRDGDNTGLIVGWTADSAVNAMDKNGQTKNTLEVNVTGSKVNFLVNGKQVESLPVSKFKNTAGQVGLRINHHLNIDVKNFMTSKM